VIATSQSLTLKRASTSRPSGEWKTTTSTCLPMARRCRPHHEGHAVPEDPCLAGSASLVCAMLLPSGPANTRCSVCRFDPGGLHVPFSPAPGTGLESPETGSQNRGYRDLSQRQTARAAFEPAKIPANCGLFVRDRETPVRIGLRSGGCSLDRTGLRGPVGGCRREKLSIQSIFPSIKRGVIPVYKKGVVQKRTRAAGFSRL
jgi:hypothetical protein